MAAPNFYRVRPLTGESALSIASGASASAIFPLDCSPFLGLQVPVLDSCTLQVSGCITAVSSGDTMVPVLDKNGITVLLFPTTTGNFVLGTEAMEDLLGCTHIQIGTPGTNQSALRQFKLVQKTSL